MASTRSTPAVAEALITHRLCPDTPQWRGAISIVTMLSCMMVGPCLPFLAVALYATDRTVAGGLLATVIALSYPIAFQSPKWCRFYLESAGWFRKGVFLHFEPRAVEAVKENASLWCMHPHGTAMGFGFSLNGAIRLRADDDARYMPAGFADALAEDRKRSCDGVMAPVLFRIPFLRNALFGFGCCTHATKAGMFSLFKKGRDFGILPGGMEEVALYREGTDRVFLRTRAGFVKYALQHGYLLQPAYTFGESDLYSSLQHPLYRAFCLFTLRRFGFVVPCFWGPRMWCPLLPRDDIPLNTVVGRPVLLPKTPNPTNEDVAKWHAAYIAAIQGLFDTYKARFGYADRVLDVQ